ncbi:MAG: hypothetical protein ACOVSR_16785 [Bacteroidia bacterium]
MYKISFSNITSRLVYFFIGIYFIVFYCLLSFIMDWQWNFNLGVIIYFAFASLFLTSVIKFSCLDFDLFICKEGFVLKNIKKEVFIKKDISFKIESLFIGTLFFSTVKIKFENGQSYYFRYKMYKLSFLKTIDDYIKLIEEDIRNKLLAIAKED